MCTAVLFSNCFLSIAISIFIIFIYIFISGLLTIYLHIFESFRFCTHFQSRSPYSFSPPLSSLLVLHLSSSLLPLRFRLLFVQHCTYYLFTFFSRSFSFFSFFSFFSSAIHSSRLLATVCFLHSCFSFHLFHLFLTLSEYFVIFCLPSRSLSFSLFALF